MKMNDAELFQMVKIHFPSFCEVQFSSLELLSAAGKTLTTAALHKYTLK